MSSSRSTSRNMYRIASLYNGVVSVQLAAMYWDVLVDHYLNANGKLELCVQSCHKPIAEQPLFGENVSESIKRTAVSVNKCVAAISYNTVWLAYCIEGLKFDIKEITFFHPKPVHQVELYLVGNGQEEQQVSSEYPHTVLAFDPDDKDVEPIVADATYAQYSFESGIDTYATYCVTKVDIPNEGSVRGHRLGRAFRASAGNAWEERHADAITFSTNNVVHKEMGVLGGIEVLLNMSADEFEGAQDNIVAAVKREMEALRLRLESIYHSDSPEHREQLADLVKDCDGDGHQTCLTSYHRRL